MIIFPLYWTLKSNIVKNMVCNIFFMYFLRLYQLVLCAFIPSLLHKKKTLLPCIFQLWIGFCVLHLRLFLFRFSWPFFVLAFLVCAMAFVYAFVCALGSDQCSAFPSCLLYFFLLFLLVDCCFLCSLSIFVCLYFQFGYKSFSFILLVSHCCFIFFLR